MIKSGKDEKIWKGFSKKYKTIDKEAN